MVGISQADPGQGVIRFRIQCLVKEGDAFPKPVFGSLVPVVASLEIEAVDRRGAAASRAALMRDCNVRPGQNGSQRYGKVSRRRATVLRVLLHAMLDQPLHLEGDLRAACQSLGRSSFSVAATLSA